MPSPVEVAPDAVPMPEAWGGPKSLEELFQPKSLQTDATEQSPKQTAKLAAQQKRKKKKYPFPHPWQTVSRKINEIPDKVLTITTHTESTDNEHDFTIHSAEEARRAIIWGEILQRKY